MNVFSKVALGLGLTLGLAVPALAHDRNPQYQRDWQHAAQHQQIRDEHHDDHDALREEHDEAHAYGLSRWEHRQLHRDLRHQHRDEHRDLRRQHSQDHDRNYYDSYRY